MKKLWLFGRTHHLRVVFDGKIPRKPKQSNRGSLCHCQPLLFPCEDELPVGSIAPPQPTEADSGSSKEEDEGCLLWRSTPYLCQQHNDSPTFSISTFDLNLYLPTKLFLKKNNSRDWLIDWFRWERETYFFRASTNSSNTEESTSASSSTSSCLGSVPGLDPLGSSFSSDLGGS